MRRLLSAFLLILGLAATALAPATPAQSQEYRIQPGDLLDVTVLEDATLNRRVLVLPDGRISLPLAGTVVAGGQTIEQVQRNVAQRLASNFAVEPNIFIALASLAPEPVPQAPLPPETITVFATGQVLSPGAVQVPPGTTLLQAMGLIVPDRFAAKNRIQVRRTDPRTGQQRLFVFDFRAVEKGGTLNTALPLQDGDVIVVPERRLFE
jgi:polysaccharide export outer membrane protein